MSQQNVEIVRGIYDAVARRDDTAPFEAYADDIVWDLSNWRPAELDPMPVYTGHEGVREAWRDRLSAWGEVDYEVEELMDVGDHPGSPGWTLQRRADRQHPRGGLDVGRRQGHSAAGVRRPPGGPRSRGAAGVGDVARGGPRRRGLSEYER